MNTYPKLPNEAGRLVALDQSGVWHSGREPEFDAIVQLAASILDCPIALISIVGEDEQWFKAKIGLEVSETCREVAFCAHTIADTEPMVVEDARLDPRFAENPLVTGNPKIAFYAGVPIAIDGEHNIGTLCVIDQKPRLLTDAQRAQLLDLGRVAEGLINAFKTNTKLEAAKRREKAKSEEFERTVLHLEQIKDMTGIGGWEFTLNPQGLKWTDETKRIHEVSLDYEPQLESAIEFYAPEAQPVISSAVETAIETGTGWDLELQLITARGNKIWVRALGNPVYEDRAVTKLIGTFQDITAQKRTEEFIKKSEKIARERSSELSTILQSMDEGVSVFGKDDRLTVWNERYIEIFEKPEGEIREGVDFRSLLEAEKARGEFDGDIDHHIRKIHESLKADKTLTSQFQTKSGRVIKSNHVPMPGGGWVGTHSDVTVEIQAAERDKHASMHDPLTGLPNRLAFNDALDKSTKNPEGDDDCIVLMLLDLDKFKAVNDTHGHQAGDELLVGAAQRLIGCVRKGDLVARLGGDEFAILLKCSEVNARSIAEAMASKITEIMCHPFRILQKHVQIGASVGIRIMKAEAADTDELFNDADLALYKVKEASRGSYRFHDDDLAAEQMVKTQVASAVRSSDIARNVELHFQPVFELKTLKRVGAEALLRWKDTSHFSIPPSEIVRIAEENGAMANLGNWMLRQSIETASRWPGDQCVSVNVSASQLGEGTLYDEVVWALDEYDFPALRLELELTETVFLKEAADIMGELSKIQALGVDISLDDFGTEYASLSHMERFAFDRLKIARTFLSEGSNKFLSKAIVQSITAFARKLGIETSIEGIETAQHLQDMTEIGCIFGQGAYLAEPMPASDFLSDGAPSRDVG
ncbi:MAG: EAL domain-containing protein [Pseudomonadota bacterium]